MSEIPVGAQPDSLAPPRAPGPTHASWGALAIAGIAQMLVMLDSTVVNVALPSIGRDLPAGTASLQWTISGYVLTYGALLLFGGRLADTIGRRRAFMLGVTIFGVASVACGLATDEYMLVFARIAQGVGAAFASAAALSIIVATYGAIPKQLNTALTVWSGLGVVGATLGVILGGLVVESLSWRWAFLINAPICIAVGVAALFRLEPMRNVQRQSLQVVTALVATLSVGLLCFGFIQMQEGVASWVPWVALAFGVVSMVALVRHQNGADDPLLPVFLLKDRIYAWSGVGLILAATLMLGALYLSSNYLQDAHGLTPLQTGLALLPLCLGSLISAFALPALAARVKMTTIYLGGVGLQLVSIIAIIADTRSGIGGTAAVIVILAVFGLGLPAMFVPLYTFGTSLISAEHAGVGSGLLNTFNESGAGIGLAVVAPISATIIAASLDSGESSAAAAASGMHSGFIALAVASLLAGLAALKLRAHVSARAESSPAA